jgi:hypothetical protein
MSDLLQTVIPAAVTFLVGYQGALTRTSRLRKSIRADMDMLDALPEGHPSRAALTAPVEELNDTLVRREARQFEPLIPAGTSFGVHAALTVVMVLAVLILGLEVTGLYYPDPPNPDYGVAGVGLLRGPDAHLRRLGVPGLAADSSEVTLHA